MQGCPQSHTAEKCSVWVGTQVYMATEPSLSPVPLRGHPPQDAHDISTPPTHKTPPCPSGKGVEAPLGLCFPTGE